MSWRTLLSPDIQKFIKDHEKEDTAALALKKPPRPDWPYTLILQQIKARKKARLKIPDWLDRHPDIVLPRADIIEQASSAATALYKAGLIEGQNFIDLTGGAGVDSWAMSRSFKNGACIDKDEENAALLAHNLPLLTGKKIEVLTISAEQYIADMPPVDLILIDPARRTQNKKGLYEFNACTPDVTMLLPVLLNKASTIIIKASPMLDIDQGIAQLQNVSDVHVVEYDGECKELLFIITPHKQTATPTITAATLDNTGAPLHHHSFTRQEEAETPCSYADPAPQSYLFEPGPAFQKAGGLKTLTHKLGLKKIAPNTHLLTGEALCPDMPGRSFKILGIHPVRKKALPLTRANLSARNFPVGAKELRKKLGLKDGGDDYIFACTNRAGQHILIHTQKP